MAYKVLEVLTHDTIKVTPEWRVWKLGKGGDKIKIRGLQLPTKSSGRDRSELKIELFNLLLSKVVNVEAIYQVNGKTVLADVSVGEKNVLEHFPEHLERLNAAILAPTLNTEEESTNDATAEAVALEDGETAMEPTSDIIDEETSFTESTESSVTEGESLSDEIPEEELQEFSEEDDSKDQ